MCDTNVRMDGKVVVVTGGSSGIGYEAAKILANRGAKVVIASRTELNLQKARDEIIAATGNQNVAYKILDLTSLKSVRHFVKEINVEKQINILINNAGGSTLPDRLTEDKLNLSMQTNYFGNYLLTYLLLPKLKVSAPSRIINVVGLNMYVGEINYDHWNDIGRYSKLMSAANSKLALALFNAELDERLKDTGVTANTYDPFVVRDTNIVTHSSGFIRDAFRLFSNVIGQRREEGGKQIAYLAAAPELEGVGGKHFIFYSEVRSHWLANDRQFTKRLWEETKKVVKINDEEDWENN